ncbi:hypothetical protein [Paraburkholderia youngii]|uniref:hypothetical protein n=1 Tax=Paraburkholderia youngii TaxID=2782701 RepID=UPI003D1FEBA6
MLEKLLDIQVAYERTLSQPDRAAPGSFGSIMREAFPDLLRAFLETLDENRQLRGFVASPLVVSAANAAKLEFARYSDPATGEPYDSQRSRNGSLRRGG